MSIPRLRQWIAPALVVTLVAILPGCGGGGSEPSGPQTLTFNASDVPQAIRDFTTIQSTISASGMRGTISSVTVNVNITHTFIGDLIVSVRGPNGVTSVLHNRAGGSTDNIISSFSPTGFAGGSPNGAWVLTVSDNNIFDSGTLNTWSVTITSN